MRAIFMRAAAGARASATPLPRLRPRRSDAGTAKLAATRLGDVTGELPGNGLSAPGFRIWIACRARSSDCHPVARWLGAANIDSENCIISGHH